jgi:dTDP-glucose pyrophosphorylase
MTLSDLLSLVHVRGVIVSESSVSDAMVGFFHKIVTEIQDRKNKASVAEIAHLLQLRCHSWFVKHTILLKTARTVMLQNEDYKNARRLLTATSLIERSNAVSIEEKPLNPKSNFVIPGLYFYPEGVSKLAKSLEASSRGELEITALNNLYLEQLKLQLTILERGTVWLDTGTVESLHDAAAYVRIVEERQGLKISCIEEIAWRNGWISTDQLVQLAVDYKGNPFGKYLIKILSELDG